MAMTLAARRGRGGRSRAPMAEINVTPFVDVMLVLLIIFMVAAPLLASGVPVELPESRAEALTQDSDQLTVTITGDGAIYLDDAAMAAGELPARLGEAIPAGGEAPLVTLRADRALDYGRVMAVMGELSRAGFTSISLVTSGSVDAP